ncbi:hmg-box dna-binding protein [Moniliophthora roreri MCA 2997]|uniref:Hmg-box dna-binding protein n=2 Tax=Moniliophthora roreri TaxID=221103 RepID=V2WRF1_MONRO|nr:hmg-box dna-binding protein [Moniliophthora roreri MCA 2997]KAI3619798.1 hmg-box dna-binding protein [Moniliophthora roreri]
MSRKAGSDTSEPPRPPNAWILFRSEHAAQVKQELERENGKAPQQGEISRMIAKLWNANNATKQDYQVKAEQVRRQHQQKYPGYRYRKRWQGKLREEKVRRQNQEELEPASGQQTQVRTRTQTRMHPYRINSPVVPQSRSPSTSATRLPLKGILVQNPRPPTSSYPKIFGGTQTIVYFGSLDLTRATGLYGPTKDNGDVNIPPPSPALEALLRLRFDATMATFDEQRQPVPDHEMLEGRQLTIEQGSVQYDPNVLWNQAQDHQRVNINAQTQDSAMLAYPNAIPDVDGPGADFAPQPGSRLPYPQSSSTRPQLEVSNGPSGPGSYEDSTGAIEASTSYEASSEDACLPLSPSI